MLVLFFYAENEVIFNLMCQNCCIHLCILNLLHWNYRQILWDSVANSASLAAWHCLRGRDSLFFRLQWIQTLVFWAGIVWNIALGHSLQHSHPIWATVYILSCSISPSSLLIPQVGEQWRMAWEHGSQHLCETPGWIFRLPPLVRSISSCCNHSENEPADGRSLFLSLPLPLSL